MQNIILYYSILKLMSIIVWRIEMLIRADNKTIIIFLVLSRFLDYNSVRYIIITV